MKTVLPDTLEAGRLRTGDYGTTAGARHGGFFVVGPQGAELKIISSGVDFEFGWEHVSVSVEHRTPNWAEMCFVKELFWRDDECVVQYHPPKAEYINHHPFCLHLWRPVATVLPTPPSILVGPKGEAVP